jgi:recombination protein RecT
MSEFEGFTGASVVFSEEKKRLAQHLFIKCDSVLKELEAKRQQKNEKNKAPFIWENVNLQKMAIDSVARIELGLDALSDNHIHPIPYFNGKTKKYDFDLRPGYIGKHYYKMRFALDPPKDIIYELVYSNDDFGIIKRDFKNKVEKYKLIVKNPFNRGKIVGGFGYLIYEDQTKNRVIIVSEAEFLKSRALAPTKTFWDSNPEMMRKKTLVNRVTKEIHVDPQKVANLAIPESLYKIEADEKEDENTRPQELEVIETTFEEMEPPEGQPGKEEPQKPEHAKTAQVKADENGLNY